MMTKKSTKIKKLIIELSGKEVELTLEEAQELRDALNELFEVKEIIKTIPISPQPEPWKPTKPWPKPTY